MLKQIIRQFVFTLCVLIASVAIAVAQDMGKSSVSELDTTR